MAGAGTIPRFLWPFEIDGTNGNIKVTSGAVTEVLTVAPATYYWALAANKFAGALQNALNTNTGGSTYTVTLGADGKLTVASDQAVTLFFNDPLTTLSPTLCGFIAFNYSDAVAPFSLVSPNQVQKIWNPEQEYIRDTEDFPTYGVSLTTACAGQQRGQRWRIALKQRDVELDLLPPRKIFQAEEVVAGESFERFYAYLSTGGEFIFQRDVTSGSGWYPYVIRDQKWLSTWPPEIPSQLIRLFSLRFPMQQWVA